MSKFDKLLDRFLRLPNDFTYDELRTLLSGFGYKEFNKGKTSGSRVAFIQKESKYIIRLHKPHPGNIIKKYAMDQILEELKNQGVIK